MSVAQALDTPSQMPQDIWWMNAAATALAVILGVLLLAAAFQVLSRQPVFHLRQLTIEGELHRNNLATVRANVVPRVAGDFFAADLRKAREVFESVPWVRTAVVRRVWPNELRITLEEHRPAAYWHHDDGDDQLVNDQGEVFDANLGDVEDEPMPTLHAPTHPAPGQAQRMLNMLRHLTPVIGEMNAEIDTLRLTDRGSWSLKLDDDAVIELGRGETDEVVARASRFVRTLPQLSHRYPASLLYADLRYPKGYAVRLKGMTTMQENPAPNSVGNRRRIP